MFELMVKLSGAIQQYIDQLNKAIYFLLNIYCRHIDQRLLIFLAPPLRFKFPKYSSVYDQTVSQKVNANHSSGPLSCALHCLVGGHSVGRTQLFQNPRSRLQRTFSKTHLILKLTFTSYMVHLKSTEMFLLKNKNKKNIFFI